MVYWLYGVKSFSYDSVQGQPNRASRRTHIIIPQGNVSTPYHAFITLHDLALQQIASL